jgi:hypothetical protein
LSSSRHLPGFSHLYRKSRTLEIGSPDFDAIALIGTMVASPKLGITTEWGPGPPATTI